jgi:hypothetical protein
MSASTILADAEKVARYLQRLADRPLRTPLFVGGPVLDRNLQEIGELMEAVDAAQRLRQNLALAFKETLREQAAREKDR